MKRPLRIALVNNRWFMAGGTTRYLFNVKALLEEHGHTVVPFGNRYPQTDASIDTSSFVDPPGDPAAPFFHQARLGTRERWSLFLRGVYSREVRRTFTQLLRTQRIDVVLSVNICNFLGPSVIDAARNLDVPYVMRLSDFNLLCPAYNFLRDGRPCEDCTRGLFAAVRHRCLQDSVAVSAARVAAMWLHRSMGVYGRVSRIITPTAFLKERIETHAGLGVPVDHVPTFTDFVHEASGGGEFRPEVVYSGRLAPEKGPDTLIEAFGLLPANSSLRLRLLGDGPPAYVEELKRRAGAVAGGRVEFEGFVDRGALLDALGGALCLALPARWYENMPNAVTEAMAMARPVLASDRGSLPEQVEDGCTGRLLPADDPEAWAQALLELEREPALAARWGDAGRKKVLREFSPQRHYLRLMKAFHRAGVPGVEEEAQR